MDVGLVTFSGTPDLIEDDLLLLRELQTRGLSVAPLVWDDTAVDWAAPALCVIRETWDYHLHLGEFLEWLGRVEQQTKVLNQPGLVRWNAHKGYLRDLDQRGISIVPTVWLEAGTRADFKAIIADRGWQKVVIKPAVSASSTHTELFSAGEHRQAQAHIDHLLPQHDLMVQPFLRSVQAYGERSLMFIEGRFTHSVRRSDPFTGDEEKQPTRAAEATEEETNYASSVLRVLPEIPLYARVDIAPDDSGRLRLMELELIEPTLFLKFSPLAVQRMAGAIMRHITNQGE